MRFYLLDSVRLLALQCDVLSGAQKKHKKFIKWCQEHLLTGIMWKLLESAHSQVYHYTFLLLCLATVDNSINNHHRLSIFLQVAQVAVPLMLHSVTLPGGSDVLWTILDEDFHRYTWIRGRYIKYRENVLNRKLQCQYSIRFSSYSDDWRVRFAAVEKATVIFRFLDDKPVKKRYAYHSICSYQIHNNKDITCFGRLK